MAEVTVKTTSLELRTVKLTKSIFKQLPIIGYHDMMALLKSQPDCVVGWVHGSVVGEDHKTFLIMRRSEGVYGTYEAMHPARENYPQVYIV